MDRKIQMPLSKEDALSLKCGDYVYLTGVIYTARDAAHKRMYDALNDLILFGGNACNNAHSLMVKIVEDLDIPVLKLAYPSNQDELIGLIDKTNIFLEDLKSFDDDLDVDLTPRKTKVPIEHVKKLLNNL